MTILIQNGCFTLQRQKYQINRLRDKGKKRRKLNIFFDLPNVKIRAHFPTDYCFKGPFRTSLSLNIWMSIVFSEYISAQVCGGSVALTWAHLQPHEYFHRKVASGIGVHTT